MLIVGGNRHVHGQDEMCYSDLLIAYNTKCNTWSTRPLSR